MPTVRHLRALQAFDVVATRLNLSKAAEDLGVTHGAVSRQIKQLEQYLGVALLRRLPNGVQLTEVGSRLHLSTRQAFVELEQGITATRRTPKRRAITVSLSSSLAIKWLVPKMPEFRQRHPGISVYLDTDDQFVDFSESDVDVALRYGSQPAHEWHSERLMQERLVVVAAPSLVSDGVVTPEEIAKLPLLHDQFHPYWDAWAEAAGLNDTNFQAMSSAFPDSAVLIAAAIDGQGAILVRRILVTDDLDAGRLIHLSDVSIEQERSLYLVCRDGDQRSQSIRKLCGWLSEVCSRT